MRHDCSCLLVSLLVFATACLLACPGGGAWLFACVRLFLFAYLLTCLLACLLACSGMGGYGAATPGRTTAIHTKAEWGCSVGLYLVVVVVAAGVCLLFNCLLRVLLVCSFR